MRRSTNSVLSPHKVSWLHAIPPGYIRSHQEDVSVLLGAIGNTLLKMQEFVQFPREMRSITCKPKRDPNVIYKINPSSPDSVMLEERFMGILSERIEYSCTLSDRG